MAPTHEKNENKKLPKLPHGARINKRPLLHPPIPSSHAGAHKQKVVYLSTKSPFMSAVKRVRKLLSNSEKRQMQSDYARLKKRRLTAPQEPNKGTHTEEVCVKAIGKAIEKALQIALFLQEQDDLEISLRTGSVTAVDDIDQNDVDEENISEGEVAEKIPESRLRITSMIEIGVTLKD